MRSPYGGFVTSSPVGASLCLTSCSSSRRSKCTKPRSFARSTFSIAARTAAAIVVVAAQHDASRRRRFTPRARLFDQALPQLAIVAAPADEAEIAAHRARARYRAPSALLRSRACPSRTSDRRSRRRLGDRRPAAAQEHRRRQVFLQRRSDTARAIRTTMQALAGKIEAQRRAIAIQSHIELHVRPLEVDRRPLARCARATDRRSRPWSSARRSACA